MINRIVTNMTSSYCLNASQKKLRVSSHIVITVCAQNVHLQHECNWVDSPTAHSMTVLLRAAHSVDASFQFVDIRDLGTIDSLLKHTPHDVVNQVEVW